jgi:hypothetical protein
VSDLQLVITAGSFSLAGVVIGALLTPLTQLYLERKRGQRTADRAKRLIAGELLHDQLVLRAASEGKTWPYIEDEKAATAYLPSSVWEENRSSLVGHVDEDLLNQLVMSYGARAAFRKPVALDIGDHPTSTRPHEQHHHRNSVSTRTAQRRRPCDRNERCLSVSSADRSPKITGSDRSPADTA